jgi:hypothetical protein
MIVIARAVPTTLAMSVREEIAMADEVVKVLSGKAATAMVRVCVGAAPTASVTVTWTL